MTRAAIKHDTCQSGTTIETDRNGSHPACRKGTGVYELGVNDCAYCLNYITRDDPAKDLAGEHKRLERGQSNPQDPLL